MGDPSLTPRSLQDTRILLVEDDDQLYRALKEALMDAGAEVLGAVALMPRCPGLIPLAHIDVAVVDASYPKGHVLIVARELKSRSIPALFIAQEPIRAVEFGECRFIAKPFDEEQLIESVASVLGRTGLSVENPGIVIQSLATDRLPASLETTLRDRAVLLVEDEYLVAMDMSSDLERAGATVVGPAGSVEDALELLERAPDVDMAVLDIRLKGEVVFAVADVLDDRRIPFVFATGYDRAIVPERYHHVPWCAKPLNIQALADAFRYG